MTREMSARERSRALADGCEHVETPAELVERLALARPLRVKLGLDPTSADLHLGHAVVLGKLQEFVADGHEVTLVIGDFTARIGDPSGRNALRPHLSDEAIAANMATYAAQAGTVLDLERVHLRYNSEWLAPLQLADLLRLLAQTTVARMLDRKDFAARYAAETPIALHEFLYPIAQAYDSVALEADVELGGSDQLFNLLMGRPYQEHAGQRPQICMTLPLLEGLDGKIKMSKSVGNHIGLAESARDQFGKAMRIPDALIERYARLGAAFSLARAEALSAEVLRGTTSAMDAKKAVAEAIAARFHGAFAAVEARENFERTVQRRELPQTMPEIAPASARTLGEMLVRAGFAQSKREAERLAAGGGVKLDGVIATDARALWPVDRAVVLSVGARRFARVLAATERP
ncbi:MAG: tyrosine--tRNA ligase [Candidatus Baltobacteraceae bacterium]